MAAASDEQEVLKARLLAKETSLRDLTKRYLQFVNGVEGKSAERKLGTGDSVGFSCVLGVTEEDQKHASTVVATEASNLATLSRADFVHVNHELGEAAVEILEKTFLERTEEDIEQALGLFAHLPFLVRLRSKLLQQHCCRQ